MDFGAFRDNTLKNVELVGSSFKEPDDDWLPVCIMFGRRKVQIAAINMNPEDKHLLPGVLKEMFREHLPELAALVMPCWIKFVPMSSPLESPEDLKEKLNSDPLARLALDMAGRFGLEGDPARKEMVRVEIASAAGEHEVWTAEIKRFPDKPPSLNKWEKPEEFGGRFHEALKHAFAASAKKRERRKT